MEKYNHLKIEKKWQIYWKKEKLYQAKDFSKAKKFYCLIEFPYPSGEGLHVGHPRSYTALDILARKKRMAGYNVLYPIGFDAFGLPTENYAVKTGIHPAQATEKNIKTFRRQLKSLGLSFDWNREIITTDPKYFKWTQWIFIKMFENGLAYKSKIPINWCLSCKIGLANEEVVTGRCERCGGEVEKREKEQWMLKITNYAERLIADLEKVDYLEKIKIQQQNWIGRSEGATIRFSVIASLATCGAKQSPNSHSERSEESLGPSAMPQDDSAGSLKVFTTRPDTLFGATFMVVAPEHQLIANSKSQIANWNEVESYVAAAKKKSDLERTELTKEKTGVEIKGIKAINPVNNQKIPIFVADYVLATYGTGAIMAVPAHDQRDFEFAKKYNLPIIQVIQPPLNPSFAKEGIFSSNPPFAKEREGGIRLTQAYEDIEDGIMANSGQFNGLAVRECIKKITNWLEQKGFGKKAVNYKLRDWVFSRQRYWGEPIPLVFCPQCKKQVVNLKSQISNLKNKEEFNQGELLNPGWIAVSKKDLPVTLPEVKKYQPTETGESPLAAVTKWVNVKCSKCGGPAKRETDTMPNWAGSNWYFLRYIDPKNDKELADEKKLEYWLPVDWYNGGMEHTTLHLLYSRFVYKFLYDISAVPKKCGPEPYKKRTSHGLILGEGGEKMSKSRGNVINPDEVVKEFGADTFRVYEMFMGPFDQPIPWDSKGVVGVRRFLERVWNLSQKVSHSENKKDVIPVYPSVIPVSPSVIPAKAGIQKSQEAIERLLHQTIKKVSEDIETQNYNTAVSALMILANKIRELKVTDKNNKIIFIYENFLKLLAPFAPHLAEELWEKLGHQKSIFKERWPEYDKTLIKEEEIELVIQVNGRVRDKIKVPAEISETQAKEMALKSEKIKRYLAIKPKKIIFVPGRLINLVI